MQWNTNRLSDLKGLYAKELESLYSIEEAKNLVSILIRYYFGFSGSDLALNRDIRLSESEMLRLHFGVKELKNHKPIQYIIQHVEFLNTHIELNDNVLIPRPETEELVAFVIEKEKNKEGLRILDIGTGSGCIAIALAKNLSRAVITGIDISEEALDIATKNALSNRAAVDFKTYNILEPEKLDMLGQFDILVSNPPYVTESDRHQMQQNVLIFEPHLALFVPGNDPLLFYRAILYFAGDHLIDGGRLYLEINERFGRETGRLFIESGMRSVVVHQDLFGKDRFVSGVKRIDQ